MTQSPLTLDDQQFLNEAARFFRDPGLVAKGLTWAGKPVEAMQRRLPEKARSTLAVVSEKAIRKALIAAVKTIPKEKEVLDRDLESLQSSRIHRAMTTFTGAAGGIVGLPALAIELPVTTVLILRAISDQARLFGHDLQDLETRLECLMVFTMGVSDGDGMSMHEKTTASYFATRASFVAIMRRAATTASAFSAKELLRSVEKGTNPIFVKLIAGVAEKFQIRVSQKFIAEGMPLIGAIGGGVLNYAFTDFFVTTARFHFGIRALEKKYGENVVQNYFGGPPGPIV